MSEAQPGPPAIDTPGKELLPRLEKRAFRLRLEAYCFLSLILALLMFGAIVFYQAPQLTSRDVSTNAEARLSSTYDEIAKLNKRNGEIGGAMAVISKTCNTYHDFFKQWTAQNIPVPGAPRFQNLDFTGRLPSGKEIADQITQVLSKNDVDSREPIAIVIPLADPCGGNVVLVQSRETYGAIVNAVNVHDFQIDRDKASALSTELSKNNQRIAFLRDVAGALYSKEVAAVANGASASESGPSSDDEKTQVIRLVQTSITRFGTLIVVSFLVAILIPSYRYNVRLAAFYAARADALVAMRSRSLEHSQFELLTTVLTPHIEFGKSPSTPLEQVVDLVRAARGADAAAQSKDA